MTNLRIEQVSYDDQLILTTEQLAEFYETTVNTIKVNFNNNKSKFEEGKHYYLLKGAQLKEFKNKVKNLYLVGKNANQLYLWTKRGASRHAKMLGTDRAWDVYDELEETYFATRKAIETDDKALLADKRLKIMERNAVTKRAQLMYKIAMETNDQREREKLLIKASNELVGNEEKENLSSIELPELPYYGNFYMATTIADMVHFTNGAFTIGKIANQHRLKPLYGTENEYCKIIIRDGTKYTLYKEKGKDTIIGLLASEGYI
ncbi:ORF6N domain-containing protein [Ligilactobacillus faecis]|uniref:ORF6N domain-containing protein n=1 Tax=Ligilactobacillus faecis TaxID=762833 RepID=UPI0024699833|nr:ORF6N domain-containing protein [Ligilactobacillus faecis]WGN89812.1 ORF6N domain-containing protein [Ligilactobacillus faecis]